MIMGLKDLQVEKLAPIFPVLVTDETQTFYNGLVTRLRGVFGDLDPANSDIYKERQQEFLQAGGDEQRIEDVLWHPAYILPLLGLWNDRDVPLQPTPKLLKRIESICREYQNGYLGLLQLEKMISLFFSRYNELEHIDALGKTLRGHLERYEDRELLFGLDQFKKHAEAFLNAQGHEHLAELTGRSGKTLPEMAEQYGIPTLNSRFFEAAAIAYYVTRLEQLDANEPNVDLLSELLQPLDKNEQNADPSSEKQDTPKVYDTKVDAPFYLGHKVLMILIDKLQEAGQAPVPLWLGTLRAIGGDPRMPGRKSQKWWAPLGNDYIKCMLAWLSALDLEWFLKTFKEFADAKAIRDKDDNDMQRMFEDRATFLQGLLRKGLIMRTRLFLSPHAKSYVEAQWKDNDEPVFSTMSGSTLEGQAAFYLYLGYEDIRAHMIEGTHNFALLIMDELPEDSPLQEILTTQNIDPRLLDIDRRSLGMGLKEQYGEDEFEKYCLYKRHVGYWQGDAVEYLQNCGIRIFETDVT